LAELTSISKFQDTISSTYSISGSGDQKKETNATRDLTLYQKQINMELQGKGALIKSNIILFGDI
jgi:hypothetical protein